MLLEIIIKKMIKSHQQNIISCNKSYSLRNQLKLGGIVIIVHSIIEAQA